MAKFIETIHYRVNFAIKKGFIGYFSPTQIDREVHSESMNIWKKYVDLYEKTKKIDAFLRPFETTEDITLNPSGVGTIATKDIIYYCETKLPAPIAGREIHLVDDTRSKYRLNHPIKTPTTDYPVAIIHGTTIEVAPATSITDITLSVLKKPVAPKYAFTTSGDRYVYDEGNSIDIEWHESLHDTIMNRVLANLGLPQDKMSLVQYSNQEKATEEQ